MRKKLAAAMLVAVLVVSSLTGCNSGTDTGKTTDAGTTDVDTTEVSTDAPSAETTEAPTEAPVYPVAGGGTVTYWASTNGNWSGRHSNFGDTEFAKALQEQTGITIEFQHPASGQEATEIAFMVAEGKYPDILEYPFTSYSGGVQQALKDGIIIPLNDIIDQYCPNLKAFLEANPDVDKLVKTEDGIYHTFPMVLETEELGITQGLFLRQDFLDKFDLEVPTTISDWYEVLTTFKNNGITSPFCLAWSNIRSCPFIYAYGVGSSGWYLDEEGKVQYGYVQDGYKEFLAEMKKWNDEGLFDADMVALKKDQLTAKMISNDAGASWGYAGSAMQSYVLTAQSSNPEYNLVAAPSPVLNEGDKQVYGKSAFRWSGNRGASISSSCENVELAAKLLDYAYSEEGMLLYNYGIEGVSYEMVDGVPTYTDLVMANPDGLSLGHAMSEYARAAYYGPFVQQMNYYTQYLQVDSVREAPSTWYVEGAINYAVPPITALPEETEEIANLTEGMGTYVSEMVLNFVTGAESLDNWDEFVKTVYEDYNLERVLEIKQQQVERYNQK